MMVGTEISRCFRMRGLERPGHVAKNPASIALQRVETGGVSSGGVEEGSKFLGVALVIGAMGGDWW
jgi:hypothetical protein